MQGNVLGQNGGGSKINGIIEEYMVANRENISAGDFVEYVKQKYTSPAVIDSNYSYSGIGIVSCVKIDTNKVFICYKDGSIIKAIVCIIENGNITHGNFTTITNNAESSYQEVTTTPLSVVCLAPTRVLILYRYQYLTRCCMRNFWNNHKYRDCNRNIYSYQL